MYSQKNNISPYFEEVYVCCSMSPLSSMSDNVNELSQQLTKLMFLQTSVAYLSPEKLREDQRQYT